jgi:hypothetical protein
MRITQRRHLKTLLGMKCREYKKLLLNSISYILI